MKKKPIIIVGGGHAAAQLCIALNGLGVSSDITVISNDDHLPYQRPPLSKSFLKNDNEEAVPIRNSGWYLDAGIDITLNTKVDSLDRTQKVVSLSNGDVHAYDRLVLATGTRARPLPHLDITPQNVCYLRSLADAKKLRERIADARNVVVIGGGFIGLEVAATCQSLGKTVSVVEMSPRLLGRSVSEQLAEFVKSAHESAGIAFLVNSNIEDVKTRNGKATSVSVNGEDLPCDLLLVSVGAEPMVDLAQAAGLECDNGILVDAYLQTTDASVYALGDCASFIMEPLGRVRMESIQNVNDQAKTLAINLTGGRDRYSALPWFWSEQGNLRLQMTGIAFSLSKTIRRPFKGDMGFTLFHYSEDKLVSVESINAPADHMKARKLLERGISPPGALVADTGIDINTFL